MALYFGYNKKNTVDIDTEELEKSISALKSSLATNNTKTKALEDSFFKKDGSIQMTGDLDLGDNSIIGIDDINANNSVVSKKYVDDGLGGKLSAVGGTFVLQKPTFSAGISLAASKINHLATPTANSDASTKKYVDDKTATNSNNIVSLAGRITLLETKKNIYSYHFTYFNLRNDWSYPASSTADGKPDFWMFCKGLKPTSFFHVHIFANDNDATLEFSYTLTFKLDFYTAAGIHTAKEIFTAQVQDHQIIGQKFFLLDKKFTPSTLSGYQNFVMARLAVKGSSTKGNEFTISCSFEI